MKKTLLILILFLSIAGYSQKDSTKIDSTKKRIETFSEVDLLSRNVWRGIDFGNYSPSVFGLVGFTYKKLEFGAYGITTLTGTNIGYGNTFNAYMALKLKIVSFYVEDYYFNGDVSNRKTNYFDWSNTHFLEGRIKLEYHNFFAMGCYTIAGGNYYNLNTPFNNTRAVYIEAGYKIEHWNFVIGGITAPSALNFHDKKGITNVSIKYKNTLKKIKNLPYDISIIYNPNFDNIAPKGLNRYGYGNNAFNFVISITII